jgi:nitrogen fixation protein FixH
MVPSRAGARRAFTGRHMAVILVTFFGVVIAVNVHGAAGHATFGGTVVENFMSPASFNGWLDEAARNASWLVAAPCARKRWRAGGGTVRRARAPARRRA